jgi:hypothetical protein
MLWINQREARHCYLYGSLRACTSIDCSTRHKTDLCVLNGAISTVKCFLRGKGAGAAKISFLESSASVNRTSRRFRIYPS